MTLPFKSESAERYKVHHDSKSSNIVTSPPLSVTKQQAPKGALRRGDPLDAPADSAVVVRKHRAPKGALRHELFGAHRALAFLRQKAPSAKRCIKT